MASTADFDALVALGRRLEAERTRIVNLLLAAPAAGALDEALLSRLAVIQGAAQAVGGRVRSPHPGAGARRGELRPASAPLAAALLRRLPMIRF